MNIIRQCVAVLLLVCLIVVMLPCAFAAVKPSVQPMWTYLGDICGTLDINSIGLATVTANGNACRPATNISLTASLQQYKNNKWVEVCEWTEKKNVTNVSLKESYSVFHGYSYRIVITANAYTGNILMETGTKTVNYGYFA